MATPPTENLQPDHDLTNLLYAIAKKDHESFRTLCIEHIPLLLRFVQSKIRSFGLSPDLAEDITHEALIRAIEWVKRNPNRVVNTAWLNKIATNLLIDRVRLQKNQVNPLPPHDGRTAKAPSFDHLDIKEAMNKLGEIDRQFLMLVFFESKTPKEAGRLMKLEPWAAYKRLERSLKKLRELLE